MNVSVLHIKKMEPTTGFEPVDLFLTKEALYLLSYVGVSENSNAVPMTAGAPSGKPCARLNRACSLWSGRRESNSRHSAWKADALPTELLPHR